MTTWTPSTFRIILELRSKVKPSAAPFRQTLGYARSYEDAVALINSNEQTLRGNMLEVAGLAVTFEGNSPWTRTYRIFESAGWTEHPTRA